MELHVSPQRLGSPTDARKSTRYPENINEDYRQKSEAIQQLIKGYREMKQEIFTPDQLLQILDMKAGGHVDRDLFLQLFLKVKKTERSEFYIKDWVEVYLEAEEILNSKINTENIKLNQLYAIENKLHLQLEEELIQVNRKAPKEKKDTFFWINIFEAEISKGSYRSQFERPVYVMLQVGEQQFRTRISDNLRAPIWNENFKIKIDESSLKKVIVKCIDVENKEYGSHAFDTASIQDNRKRNAWVQLTDDKAAGYTVKLHLSAIMLHSRIEKVQQDITANDTKIAEVTRNINDYQQMLDELYKPFQTLNLSAARHQAAPKMVIVGRPSAKAHDEEHYITRDEINMAERLRKSCAKYITNWSKAFLYLSLMIAALNLVVSMQKPAFIDLALLLYIYGRLLLDELSYDELRALLFAISVTLLIDGAWVMTFWQDWCHAFPPDLPGCRLKNHLLWVALLIIPVKICFLVTAWRNSVVYDEFREQFRRLLISRKIPTGL